MNCKQEGEQCATRVDAITESMIAHLRTPESCRRHGM